MFLPMLIKKHTNTPDLFINMLLLPGEASMLLLVGFDSLLPVHHFTVLSCCRMLSLPQCVTDNTDVSFIEIKLSKALLQMFLMKVI